MEESLNKITKFNYIQISDKIEKSSNYVMIQQYFNNNETKKNSFRVHSSVSVSDSLRSSDFLMI